MNNFQEIANFIWSIADEILRDDFKRGKYPDVILPFTVLRRLDCVLAPTHDKVLKRYQDLKAKGLENMDGQLRRVAGHSFYNVSRFDFPRLLGDPKNIGKNLRAYINGFSENMRDVIDRFKLRGTIGEDGYAAATAGVSFYFGGDDSTKSLIRRHREDDPRNRSLDIFGSGAASFGNNNGTPVVDPECTPPEVFDPESQTCVFNS